jgi:VWFA-related protein
LTTDAAAIARAIDGVEANGSTALCDAAFAALATREAVDGRTLVLLFTDGWDTTSWLSPLAVIEEARRSDVVVDAVRLDTVADRIIDARRPNRLPPPPGQARRWFLEEPHLFRHEFLAALTDETGGQLIVAGSSGHLRDVFVKIVSEFKTRYVLTYSPTNVAPSGWHPIEVHLKNKKGEVRARRGYTR